MARSSLIKWAEAEENSERIGQCSAAAGLKRCYFHPDGYKVGGAEGIRKSNQVRERVALGSATPRGCCCWIRLDVIERWRQPRTQSPRLSSFLVHKYLSSLSLSPDTHTKKKERKKSTTLILAVQQKCTWWKDEKGRARKWSVKILTRLRGNAESIRRIFAWEKRERGDAAAQFDVT